MCMGVLPTHMSVSLVWEPEKGVSYAGIELKSSGKAASHFSLIPPVSPSPLLMSCCLDTDGVIWRP